LSKKRNYLDVFVAPEELASEAAIEVHAEAEGPMGGRAGGRENSVNPTK
jgi:hypothetical protein